MRRRQPSAADLGGLPPELAAGPLLDYWLPADHVTPSWMSSAADRRRCQEGASWRAWANAATAWSRANGHGPNGWKALLPPEVRDEYLPSALERARRAATVRTAR